MRTVDRTEHRASAPGTGRTAGATATAALAALCLLTAGCGTGDDEPTGRSTADTTITAGVGERFTLTFPDNNSTRDHWYLAAPKPDGSVVRSRGSHDASDPDDDPPQPGGGGRRVFTFEATGEGSTRIVLLHCTATTCAAGSTAPPPPGTGTSSPAPEPARVTYRVTVG
jgi:inhibitor of cysteine peptidase